MADELKEKKLVIAKGKSEGKKITFDDQSSSLTVCFNPEKYTLDKSNTFQERQIPGLESPLIQYSHGQSRSLTLDLMLDTYMDGKNESVNTKYIDFLEKLMSIDGDLHAAPPCKIVWGELIFVGVLKQLKKDYTLFLKDGTPVRARVTLTLNEYIPVDLQVKSPPRSSPDRRKLFQVKEGDKAYGKPGLWRILADANDIANPRELEIGKDLIIPVLEK
jgi:hypothetical protein